MPFPTENKCSLDLTLYLPQAKDPIPLAVVPSPIAPENAPLATLLLPPTKEPCPLADVSIPVAKLESPEALLSLPKETEELPLSTPLFLLLKVK